MSCDRPRARTVLTTALLLVAAACGDESSARGRNARKLPNPELQDQHGRTLHFYDDLIAGKKVVVQFMYTRCDGICPAATGNLVAVQNELREHLGRDLHFVSISLDPARDTPQDLADYALGAGMGDGWTLVTGAPTDVEDLRQALGAWDPDPALDGVRSNHSAMLVLGDDVRDRWTMVSGLSPATAIARAVRRMLQG